jgi:hypothetical protein
MPLPKSVKFSKNGVATIRISIIVAIIGPFRLCGVVPFWIACCSRSIIAASLFNPIRHKNTPNAVTAAEIRKNVPPNESILVRPHNMNIAPIIVKKIPKAIMNRSSFN